MSIRTSRHNQATVPVRPHWGRFLWTRDALICSFERNAVDCSIGSHVGPPEAAWAASQDAAQERKVSKSKYIPGIWCLVFHSLARDDAAIPRLRRRGISHRIAHLGLHAIPIGRAAKIRHSQNYHVGLKNNEPPVSSRRLPFQGHTLRDALTSCQSRRPLEINHNPVLDCRPGPPRLAHSTTLLSIISIWAPSGILQWLVELGGIAIRQSGPFNSARTAARH